MLFFVPELKGESVLFNVDQSELPDYHALELVIDQKVLNVTHGPSFVLEFTWW